MATPRLHPTAALTLAILALLPPNALAVEAYSFTASHAPLAIHGAASNDLFGTQSSGSDDAGAGDLNGDGIPDLVVGVRQLDGPGNTRADCGEVDVFYGPLLNGQVWDLATRPPDLRIYGREVGGQFGSAVRVADINGDGAMDLAVGAPLTRRPDLTATDRGEVCIFFGPLGSGVMDLAVVEPGFCVVGARRYDSIGESIAIGDVSGDGIPDLIAGGWSGAHGTSTYLGGLYVLFGPITPGPIRDLRFVPPDVTIMGMSDLCSLGSRVELGDLSGDGQVDIAAAMPYARPPPGSVNTGAVAVLFGPLSAGIIDLRTTAPDVLLLGGDAGDSFGYVISVADLSGDGVDELVAGAYQADGVGNLRPGSGEVHVLLGPLSSGTTIDNRTTLSDIIFTRPKNNTSFGRSLAAASVGSGGRLLLGAPDDLGTACLNSGNAFVVTTLPLRGTIVDVEDVPGVLVIGWGPSEDCSNTCLQFDLSGDSIPEMLVGGPWWGPDRDRPSAGVLYVVGDDDRCEEVPPEIPGDGLHLRRAGDDVLLDFDAAGLGPEMLAVDVFRGSLRSLTDLRLYDHAVIAGGCGAMTSPFVDVAGAAPGVETRYYLVTRGCPASCDPMRFQGPLGTDSLGVQRPLPWQPDPFTCQ